MKFSYNKLWKLLIDRDMNKGDLQKLIETGPSTISRMGRNEPVRLEILGRICEKLDCNIEDIIEYERGRKDLRRVSDGRCRLYPRCIRIFCSYLQ